MLTSARPGNASYLGESLDALEREGVIMLDVTVVDTDGAGKFALQRFPGAKAPDVRGLRTIADCVDDGKDVATGVPCRVMQSNYDVSMALALCSSAAAVRGRDWVLVVEDDAVACPGSLKVVRAMLDGASVDPRVCLIFFAKFSRSYAIRATHALDLLASVRMAAAAKPYDWVLGSRVWSGQALRTDSSTSLFEHVGEVSTASYRNEQGFQEAHEELRGERCGQQLVVERDIT